MSGTSIEGYLLSPQQLRLWQFSENQLAVNQLGILIEGRFPEVPTTGVQEASPSQQHVLQEIIDALVQRHEVLRTTFARLPEMTLPLQCVQPDAPCHVKWITADPKADLVRTLQQIGEEHREQTSGFEVTCVTFSETTHGLVFSLPTLLGDHATLSLLAEELFNSSPQKEASGSSPCFLDVFPCHHVDYQHGITPMPVWTELPYGVLPRAATSPSTQVHASLPIKSSFTGLLGDWEIGEETLYLACWAILLQRLTEQEVFTIGIVNDGRHQEFLKLMSGPIAATVPMPISVGPQDNCREFMQKLDRQSREREDSMEIAPPGIVHSFRQPGPEQLHVQFEFFRLPLEFTRTELKARTVIRRSITEPFVLKLSVDTARNENGISIDYDASSYPEETIQQLCQQYLSILADISKNRPHMIGEIQMESVPEQDLLEDFSEDLDVEW